MSLELYIVTTETHLDFAGAVDETGLSRPSICPCTQSDVPYTGPMIPSFVGQDYFCDTGSRGHFQYGVFYADDPL